MRGGRVGCGDGVGTHDWSIGTCPGSGTFPGLRRSQSRITSYGDGDPAVGDGVGPSTANGAGAPASSVELQGGAGSVTTLRAPAPPRHPAPVTAASSTE